LRCVSLQELFKVTPAEWIDYNDLSEAIKSIDTTVKAANEAKRVTDDLLTVMAIQNKLLNATGEAKQLHKHEFIMEESFRRVSSKGKATKCHFFLFKDLLLIAEPSGSQYNVTNVIPAAQLLICHEPDTSMWLVDQRGLCEQHDQLMCLRACVCVCVRTYELLQNRHPMPLHSFSQIPSAAR
jgi:hypothetical protein